MRQTDAIVLDKIAQQVLSVDVLDEIVANAIAAAQRTDPAERLQQVKRELRSVQTQVSRYVDAIGRGVTFRNSPAR